MDSKTTPRATRLADQLDAALDGHSVDLPGELVPLVAIAQAIREAARRDPQPSPQAGYPSRRPHRAGRRRPCPHAVRP